jgi:hypothetical protein
MRAVAILRGVVLSRISLICVRSLT